jgi:PIN domain nuclease of toxin-antitoxin system
VLEIARLVALGQRALPCSVDDFVAQALAENFLLLLDLTPRILIDSTRLPGMLHRDPSDRLLVATARAHGLTLITRDKQLLAYAKQGHMNARKP